MRNSGAVLSKGRFRTDVFKFSFFNRIVHLWNGLPVVIRITNQLSLLSKNGVNEFYIDKFNSNKERFLWFLLFTAVVVFLLFLT